MRARCYRCQNTFETDRFGTQRCPNCGSEIHLPDPSAPPAVQSEPAPAPAPAGGPQPESFPGPLPGWAPLPHGAPSVPEQSAPFAERAQRGFVSSYVETWKLAALEPARFFRQVRISETGSAVLFGLIAVTLGLWASLTFRYLSANATMSFVTQFTRWMGEGRLENGPLLQMMRAMTLSYFLGSLVATPIAAFLVIILTAAVFHIVLLLVRGAPRGFESTLTVVGYAYGVFIVQALPVCGGVAAILWFAIAAIHGISESQRCGTAKAAFAVLTPALLACLCSCAAAVLGGLAAGVSSLRGVGNGPPSTGI